MSSKPNKPRRLRKRLLIALGVTIAAVCAGCIFLWLLVIHVPSWYRPPYVPESRYAELRTAVTDTVSAFGDQLVAGEPFEVVLTAEELSEWLVARGEIWPEADGWVPPFLKAPMVAFRPGQLVLAGRMEKSGWQVVVSLHFSMSVTEEHIRVRLDRIAGGSFPVPVGTVARQLQPVLAAKGQDIDAMPDLLADAVRLFREGDAVEYLREGSTTDNRFYWGPSSRWFRIQSVEMEEGRIRLWIQPLMP